MRRISAKCAKPGQVLGYAVYDNYGKKLMLEGTKLDQRALMVLLSNAVSEIFIEDWRMADVPVAPLISPELEGRAASALQKLYSENYGRTSVSIKNIAEVSAAANAMVEGLRLSGVAEVAVTGVTSENDYINLQPVKTALLSLVLGQALKFTQSQLGDLAISALCKDVGYISIPQEIIKKPTALTNIETAKIKEHNKISHHVLRQHATCAGDIATAVLQHHERWNGKGYHQGLKGASIHRFAQVITLSDIYTSIMSRRPGERKIHLPHEAIEFIMAYSGEYFNPELVELFVRRVSCYSSGLMVRLNTGEVAIVSDPKAGFVGRPIVRICYEPQNGLLKKPYDIDLSRSEFQQKLIVEILDYVL
jgi:HD-GYP domain-containing protein (c-di-GMP phosphodiesterase class II)